MTSVAVIGTGHWGRNLLRNFATLGALAAFHDSDPANFEAARQAYPAARACSDFDAILADPAIEAVVIATPAATHGALARKALHAGKHVFVEKPLCLDLAEGRELEALATSSGHTLMVGHLLLYHPAFIALQAFVADGRIGTLRYIYSNRTSLGRIRREENAFWSFAPHDLSMILALVHDMPTQVVCAGSGWLLPHVADTTLTHLTFAQNVQAHVFVSWLHPYKEHRMVAVGSEGMVVFDDVLQGAQKLAFYQHKVGWDGDLPSVDRAAAQPIPYETDEPLARECRHFLDCLRTGATPRTDAAQARQVLSVLDAGQRSLMAGGRPTVPNWEAGR
ncbi:MAG: Gfo/Idh/MocA family protein [Alphaproteobacteria bacterium]